MGNKISIGLGIAVLIVSLIAVYQNHQSSVSFTDSLDEVKDSVNEVKNTVDESMSTLARNQLAGLEQESSKFDPELIYRIYSISANQYLPYSLNADITNTHNDNTFVKNKWTITGNICDKDGNHVGIAYDYSGRNSLDLVPGKEESASLQIPPEFFTNIFPDKKGFLVKLELEMNPYIPSIEPLGNIEFPEMTYIQYDFKEDIESWMPTKLPDGELNCSDEPSKWGQVFLNTSSIDDFYDHSDYWTFPEE